MKNQYISVFDKQSQFLKVFDKQRYLRIALNIIVITVSVLLATYIDHQYEMYEKSIIRIMPYMLNSIMISTNYTQYKHRYNETRLNFIDNPNYCQNSDKLKFLHPYTILQDKYIVRDMDSNNLQKLIIRKRAFDAVPSIKHQSKPVSKYLHVMPPEISYYYTFTPRLEENYVLGQGIGCMFQKLNHLPGIQGLVSKNTLIDRFQKYIEDTRQQGKDTECIDQAKFFPMTYRLNVKSECEQFFNEIVQSNYSDRVLKEGPEWIIKTDAHRGEGVELLFYKTLNNLTEVYEGKCGEIKDRKVAQRYINRPFLFKKHKIEFRMYVFIASSLPFTVYVYKRPLIKRCASIFNASSEEISSHICNTAVVEKTKKRDIEDSDVEDREEEGDQYIDWDFESLQSLLLSQNRIQDKDWLKEQFYPLIYRTLIHMIKSSQQPIMKDSRFAEFLAVDFILDDDLRIWLLEVNFNPQILSVTPDRIVRNYKMIEDTMEIAFAFIRSRYLRLKDMLNYQILPFFSKQPKKVQQDVFNNQFQSIIQNLMVDKIEEPFELSKANLYQLIIDESQVGEKAYLGFIDQKCI